MIRKPLLACQAAGAKGILEESADRSSISRNPVQKPLALRYLTTTLPPSRRTVILLSVLHMFQKGEVGLQEVLATIAACGPGQPHLK
jgi:hypothetical protein